jgi:Na+-translocating ferredoxin:NAD+ oxidoreductase RnfA subunit
MTKIFGKEVMASFSVGFVTIMFAISLAFFTNQYMWVVLSVEAMKVVNFILWITVWLNLISVVLKLLLKKLSK